MPRHTSTVIWLTAPKAPAPCAIDNSLTCEIPTTRHTLLENQGTCVTEGNKCAGLNNADATLAEMANDEQCWRISRRH